MYYIYGHHSVEEAIKNKNREIISLICLPQYEQKYTQLLKDNNRRIRIEISKNLMFLGDCVNQGVCIEVSVKQVTEILDARRVLMLDQIRDVRNLGAIMRSAAAMNIKQIIYTKSQTMDIYDVKNYAILAKAASGACEHVELVCVTNLSRCIEDLKKRGFWIMGLDETGKDIEECKNIDKLIIIIGAEGDGLRRLTLEKCDFCCKINTNPNFPCLNASVAASLAMYVLK